MSNKNIDITSGQPNHEKVLFPHSFSLRIPDHEMPVAEWRGVVARNLEHQRPQKVAVMI
jgi:hypothetical protein